MYHRGTWREALEVACVTWQTVVRSCAHSSNGGLWVPQREGTP
jgi:hypothetical protein